MSCCVIGCMTPSSRHRANLFRLRSLSLNGICVGNSFLLFSGWSRLLALLWLILRIRSCTFYWKIKSARKNPGVRLDSNRSPLKRRILWSECSSTELAGPALSPVIGNKYKSYWEADILEQDRQFIWLPLIILSDPITIWLEWLGPNWFWN